MFTQIFKALLISVLKRNNKIFSIFIAKLFLLSVYPLYIYTEIKNK